MPFELVSTEINGLVDRRLLNDVLVERFVYTHSKAQLVIDWDESVLEGVTNAQRKRPTAHLGASMLDAKVSVVWRGKDMQLNVPCFSGYVTGVAAQHTGSRSYVILHCISHSKQTDLIPHYRVWQACTLLDICQHIESKDSTFQVLPDAKDVLGNITIDLSVQYEETDFAYLSRMLHAWGIPMAVNDRTDKVLVGAPSIKAGGAFPDVNWHCDSVSLEADLVPLDEKSRNPGDGPTGIAKKYVNLFNSNLSRSASAYLPRLDDEHKAEREWITERVNDSAFQSNTAVYRLHWSGAIFDYSPGSGVKFGEGTYLVRSSRIRGEGESDNVSQEFELQDYPAPLEMYPRRVSWPSRMFWACVTNNKEDPLRQGRIQVKFDWEALDATVKGDDRCWLPTVTPYSGLKGTSGTSGLLCLPEVGERVLVQFLSDWDSDAVVIGSVREYPREGFKYDPHDTKRLQTPSGNQVTLTTKEDGSDIVRVKVQDKLMLEGKITSSKQSVIFDLFDSDDERIHFEKGGGPTRLDIMCSGEIYMKAGQKLLLEGGMVQIKSTSGPINIDGAPMVMVNCGPRSLQPLKRDAGAADEGGVKSARRRAKPSAWASTLTPSTVSQSEKPKTFIKIELKDDIGDPVPGERYRIKLPDGSIREGSLDANGRASVDGIDPGTAQVSFPDIDANDWKPA